MQIAFSVNPCFLTPKPTVIPEPPVLKTKIEQPIIKEEIKIKEEPQVVEPVKVENIKIEAASFLKGILFEDVKEIPGAEIYVNDFNSNIGSIRKDALDQIKKLSQKTAIPILEKLLSNQNEPIKIAEILNTLGNMNEKGEISKEIFLKFLKNDFASVRLAVIRGMSKYKDEEGYELLVAALKDVDAENRRQALNLLCWIYKEKSDLLVLKMLHDMDNSVRKTAIQICGVLKLHQAVSPLITCLSDPDKEIQKIGEDSLRKITNQKFGFNVNGSPISKKNAIEAWRFWWRENQATFGLQMKKGV